MKTVPAVMVLILALSSVTYSQQLAMDVLYLDGRDAYVQLPDGLTDGLASVTVETWVKWEKFNNWSRVFDFGREGNAMVVQNEKKKNTLNYRIWDRGGKQHGTQAKKIAATGAWSHIAVSAGSKGMEFYVDGRLVGEDKHTGGAMAVSGGRNYIGRSNWPKDKLFQGFIAEFRVWNHQRSAGQIRDYMRRLLSGTEEGLVGYWRLNAVDGTSLADLSQRQRPATMMGGGARLVSVPAIDKMLVPGELDKVAEKHYSEAKASLESNQFQAAADGFEKSLTFVSPYKDASELRAHSQGLAYNQSAEEFYAEGLALFEQRNYRRAYDAFDLSLKYVAGFKDASIRREESLLKAKYRVAIYPFRSNLTGVNVELLYQNVVMALSSFDSPFVEFVDQSTLTRLFADQGFSLGVVDPMQTLNAARKSNIRAVIVGDLLSMDADRSQPLREGKQGYRVVTQTYVEDGKKKTRQVPISDETYYLVSKGLKVTGEASYKVVDTVTGTILTSKLLSARMSDSVKYATYSGDKSYLWIQQNNWFGTSYVSAPKVEKGFNTRRDLKDQPVLVSETTRNLATKLSGQLKLFFASYAPAPMPEGSEIETATVPKVSTRQATPSPKSSQDGGATPLVQLRGSSTKDTESFFLPGGKVRMVVKVWGSSVGSFTSVELKSEEGIRLSGADVSLSSEGPGVKKTDTTIRGAAKGEYYLHVISGIEWEILIYR